MGIFTKVKVAGAVADAQKALAEGRKDLRGTVSGRGRGLPGTGAVAGAADFIEHCEELGWQLAHASYSWVPENKRGVQVLIFCRPWIIRLEA